MNLAVHLIALVAFGSCIMMISRLNAQLIFTQKLLTTLMHPSSPTRLKHDPPHLIITLLTALRIPYLKGAQIKLAGKPSHGLAWLSTILPPGLNSCLAPVLATLITLHRTKPQTIRLNECLATLQSLNILEARYDQNLLISSWIRWSIQPTLTLWVHSNTAPAANTTHAQSELADLLHTCVHVKLITAPTLGDRPPHLQPSSSSQP